MRRETIAALVVETMRHTTLHESLRDESTSTIRQIERRAAREGRTADEVWASVRQDHIAAVEALNSTAELDAVAARVRRGN